MGNEECKAARERAESIAASHPPWSLPWRNEMSADMCRNALNDHAGFYYILEQCPRPNGHIAA